MSNQLHIIDPVCIQPIGHNLPALRFFRDYAVGTNRYSCITCHAASSLPLNVDECSDINPVFTFMYEDLFSVRLSLEDQVDLSESDRVSKATDELFDVLNGADNADTVFFPSIDYYTLRAVNQWLSTASKDNCPRVIIRLINVLDWVGLGIKQAEHIDMICNQLGLFVEAGLPIRIAAETPAYATYLSQKTKIPVLVMPYPPMHSISPITENRKVFTVSSLGSARFDKGYLDLLDVFKAVLQLDRETRYRFRTQMLPASVGSSYLRYTSELGALPGSTLLPPYLSAGELKSELIYSDTLIGPYAPDVYALRGSAMLMEAISVGRPFLSYENCGFSSQVSFYQAGSICRGKIDLAQKIVELANASIESINLSAMQARYRFESDAIALYDRVMG